MPAERAEQGRGDETGRGLGHRDLHLGAVAAEIGHHLARLERGDAAADADQDATARRAATVTPRLRGFARAAWMIASISSGCALRIVVHHLMIVRVLERKLGDRALAAAPAGSSGPRWPAR